MNIDGKGAWLPMLAGALALAGCMTTAGADDGRDRTNPITAGPVAGRCYPGGCSWFDIRAFEMVRETEDGALIRYSTREGASEHRMDADAPRSSRGVRIEWGPWEDNVHVFCSVKLPAMMSRAADGSWEVQRLDLIGGGVPAEFVNTQYGHICHPDGSLDGDGAAERLGYRRLGEGEETVFTLRAPEEIFGRLRR